MNENLTELVFVIDASGSMGRLTSDTIGGFNTLIESQKKEDGECIVTFVQFNHEIKTICEGIHVDEMEPLTTKDYRAMGGTALLDAIGLTINSVGKRLSETPEDEKPSKVLFTIITDGHENASNDYTSPNEIKKMIEHQESKYNWEFNFLGANIDASVVGSTYGIKSHNTMNFSADSGSLTRGINTISAKSACYRKNVSYSVKDQEDSVL